MFDQTVAGPDSTHQFDSRAHAGEVVLSLHDLWVEYTIFEERRVSLGRLVRQRLRRREVRSIKAVQGVTLQFTKGETVGIVGRNGSGKSTLLRAMGGLIAPHAGEVLATSMPVVLGVSAALNQELSGRRNVLLGGTAMGLSRQDVEERTDAILDFAGLDDYADMPVRGYSSGMRARLQFSIAAAVEPNILFIDEALAVGDRQFRQRSSDRIKQLSAAASLVLIVSHNIGSLRDVCERVIWIDEGRVRADGPTEEILALYEDS